MRFMISALVAATFFGASVSADDDAKAIVEKAIQAKGGTGKSVAVTWKGAGKFYGMGEGIDYTGTWSQHHPDKFRMEINGAFTIVVNGEKGWINAMEMTKEQLTEQREALHGSWVMNLYPLTDKAFTLALIGASKVDGKDAVGVKVSHKGRRDVSLYFDKKTFMVLKSEQTVKDDNTGKEVTQESIVKEYMKVGDVQVPSKMLVNRDGKIFVDGSMSDYKISDKLPDGTFEKP